MTDSIQFWSGVAHEVVRGRRGNGNGDGGDGGDGDGGDGEHDALGLVHLAMYEAYVAVERPADFVPALAALPVAPPGASAAAAIAGAAHGVLAALFPDQRPLLDGKLAEAGFADDPGQPLGGAIALALLEDRAAAPAADAARFRPSIVRGAQGAAGRAAALAFDRGRCLAVLRQARGPRGVAALMRPQPAARPVIRSGWTFAKAS